MKTALTILFACICFSVSKAQDERKNHEITAGLGIGSAYILRETELSTNPFIMNTVRIEFHDPKSVGALSFGYRFHAGKRMALGIAFIYQKVKGTARDNIAPANGTWSKTAMGAMAEGAVKYIERPWFVFYGLAAAGVVTSQEELLMGNNSLIQKSESKKAYFAWQLTPVGIRAGKKLGAFLEAGYGYKGIVSAGVSLKF